MFGPFRGPWPDESWRDWWGENPVYHVPVFVLINYARTPLVMEGGTTFHFSRLAPACHLAREALCFIIRLAGLAPCLRVRLSSNVGRQDGAACYRPKMEI